MKCPFQLEPHQIQGLDFINIFPVVEWLVKRSAENRSEKAEKLKKLAASQFQNHFSLQSDREAKQVHSKQLENLRAVEDRYIPKRQFRRTEKGPEDVMSRQNVSVELTDAERSALNSHYEDLKREMSIDTSQLSEQNKIKTILATKLALEKKLARIKTAKGKLKDAVEQEQADLDEMEILKVSLEAEIHNLDNMEINEEHQKILAYVQELIVKNEKMKLHETEFKEKCKKELAELQEKIQKAETSTPDDDIAEQQKQLEVDMSD